MAMAMREMPPQMRVACDIVNVYIYPQPLSLSRLND